MGSNIGNYEPDEARLLFSLLGSTLRPGDGLLVGTDLRKDRATLEMAYNDRIGVTGAFDRNLLARINRELDADFDIGKFRHVVHYDEQRGSVDSFLEAQERMTVGIRGANLRITLEAGERIHTESSYKFANEDVARLADVGSFRPQSVWHDGGKRFSVHLLVHQ
jgi:uncharacterized SAM-dependent methyltransferase